MTRTDTSERWFEARVVRGLTGVPQPEYSHELAPTDFAATHNGYVQGKPTDYNRDVALDVTQLLAFLQATQPKVVETLELAADGIKRTQFLHRLQGGITKRGVVDVLRKGVSHGPVHVDLYKLLPTPGNAAAADAFGKNMFSVTRQVRYSNDSGNELDLVIFINGLPVLTFELKNSLTKQTLADAIVQYQTTRSPKELLFQLGRCVAHVAVDDAGVAFCTELKGKASWFLPFNQGWNSGAGNPPNRDGLKTDYLWKQILPRESLANIIESYAQVVVVVEADASGKKRKTRKQIFPRFHQLRTVRALLGRAHSDGVGGRYLIQHSAGSGKSNTIAWLAHQLVELRCKDDPMTPQFDSIIVITDRRALDTQIADTIKGYDHVAAIFGHSDNAQELREYLRGGKKIIVTTVQKFPFILDELGDLSGKRFALLIDEAHSSQGGKITARMHETLGGKVAEEEFEEEFEEDRTQDAVNAEIERRIASRKLLANASYFAFTATPKNKTLELFGEKTLVGDKVQFRSPEELTYTTKQAIQEKFILDVVEKYTPYDSFYQVAKTVADDPEFDKVKALKKIRLYVESHDKAIRRKAEIMVDHFIAEVVGKQKIGGQARAMIVCNGIARAIDYWREVSDYLTQIKSPYRAIVAYSGSFEIGGQKKTEADLNGFPSKDIPDTLKKDPYRFLIVANKFVTGFDEPLLHTMYVDKPLAGVLAVQTLSRLNRAHPQKRDTFVLDFADNAEAVKAAFQDYYRATIQMGETDPNKLHDLKAELDGQQVYSWSQVEEVVGLYVSGADRDKLDPILDACVSEYTDKLGEDDQVKFKGKAKAFVRSYGFFAAILSYGHPAWEKLSIFLNFLIPKLPAPKEEDFSKGVLETIDMDSYRVEAKAALKMAMDDADASVEPVPSGGGGGKGEAVIDRLSVIIKTFNELFGNIQWKDEDKIRKVIAEEIPARVAQDKAYQNAQANSDKQNAKLEHDKALNRVVQELLSDHTELFKQFSDNPSFKRWLTDTVFDATYQTGRGPPKAPPQVGASA
ncbi:type I restriction endonuclease subunit R [Xylella fastidiosa]|uniref:type I restriction endonuclease subunit R n=1 Tax=Xylella fastidiosa TaxID=2371 RepID=UPI0009002C79|nr:type I restriction endonuclease subunit R [Xylella fastidiosa]MDD0929013.1 type I restriction endonuclease subunit R [Xylella fastidiosa subsp. multiplex]MDD0942632.1 type I restriction endonuclease subunit R [Xylella fastidiosa subsp. multiplex]QTX27938.1 type I restriction endonuclease subunit R [Xylella fastidiosa subsp. multiplex]QTX29936.1 type I restriction endonuclease subunit R [Xylella fastidiosa subsp. multiplex]TNV90841.1 type I restriction endonuclease subunit R [Xylella fastidi